MKTQTWEVTINFWLAHLIIFTTFKFIKEWMDGWMDGAPERWRKPEACLVWVPASALHAFPLSISQPTPWRPEACSPYRERLLTGCEPPPRSKSTMEASSCCNPPNALPALPSLLSWEQDLGLAWLSSIAYLLSLPVPEHILLICSPCPAGGPEVAGLCQSLGR